LVPGGQKGGEEIFGKPHKGQKWSNKRFIAVGWEHLKLALKNKTDM
jgi:hypothetical protein